MSLKTSPGWHQMCAQVALKHIDSVLTTPDALVQLDIEDWNALAKAQKHNRKAQLIVAEVEAS